jgi:glucosamine-6-phosphate deaminase
MKITITKNEREFDVTAAWRIIAQMLEKRNSVIGLSTGQTTIGMHGIVSEIYSKYPFDVSAITLFNVDELTNLPREYSAEHNLFHTLQIFSGAGIYFYFIALVYKQVVLLFLRHFLL